MNLKNLMMWGVIIFLIVGLFQLFQNPERVISENKIAFSSFLKNVEDGRVMQVEIKGNNIDDFPVSLPALRILGPQHARLRIAAKSWSDKLLT